LRCNCGIEGAKIIAIRVTEEVVQQRRKPVAQIKQQAFIATSKMVASSNTLNCANTIQAARSERTVAKCGSR
jgi:hypothetical protein